MDRNSEHWPAQQRVARMPLPAKLLCALGALCAPGSATFLIWWALLGTDANDLYSVPQVAALVLLLIGIGIGIGCLGPKVATIPLTISAVVGISVACWRSWSDDETGLFIAGWFMVTASSLPCALTVVMATRLWRRSPAERR